MLFWFLLILMVVAAMGFVFLPVLRSNVSFRDEVGSEQTLYEARISEIEKDLELGRLDTVSAEAAKTEEARRLIKTLENSKSLSVSSGNRMIIIFAALFLPALSIPVYLNIGTIEATSPIQLASQNDAEQPTMEELLVIAEKQLAKDPDDIRGWKAIVPVYMRLQRYDDAEKAYNNIIRVEGRKPETLMRLADVYIEKNQGQIDEQARSIIAEVLVADANNANAKFYSGMVQLQQNNLDEARRIWQGMVDNSKGTENWLPTLKARIKELDALENQPNLEVQNSLPQPDSDTLEAAQDMTPKEREIMINQMVSGLDERLRDDPDDKQGWERLINAYMVLGRKEDALDAIQRATVHYENEQEFLSFLQNITKAIQQQVESSQ